MAFAPAGMVLTADPDDDAAEESGADGEALGEDAVLGAAVSGELVFPDGVAPQAPVAAMAAIDRPLRKARRVTALKRGVD